MTVAFYKGLTGYKLGRRMAKGVRYDMSSVITGGCIRWQV